MILLEGDLGAGKTTLVKGIMAGLGYHKRVLSPSFTILRCYKIKKIRVYHADLYRIKPEDTYATGFEDYLYADSSIMLIEWGQVIQRQLPCYIKIVLSFKGANRRRISISSKGYNRRFVL